MARNTKKQIEQQGRKFDDKSKPYEPQAPKGPEGAGKTLESDLADNRPPSNTQNPVKPNNPKLAATDKPNNPKVAIKPEKKGSPQKPDAKKAMVQKPNSKKPVDKPNKNTAIAKRSQPKSKGRMTV